MNSNTNHHAILDITRIAINLKQAVIGHTIDYHGTVTSTMQIAHQLATDPATRSGTVVVAEEQTAGLGRLQRQWHAPMAQALLVSLILKQEHLPINLAHLPMMAGAAAVRAIVSLAPELTADIGLKWPNDIVLGEDLAHARKVGGVLIETAFVRDQVDYAIVGIGINVNQAADALPEVPANAPPPTSLRLEMGRMLDRTALLVALCQAWEELITPQATPHDIYHEWRSLLLTLGQPVTVITHGENERSFTGVAVDVTTDGALIVVDDAGHSHLLDAGDVSTRLP
ncbi:MAG TPA: biotin--[acetyl-CoA-carboxylase] ligase [Chloroflexi bacterium]|nr:biotin--[acetyl-CoA-carboxylase] ligase [Chloroflexota bacterium]HHW88926.1 biotin--[acetyl-CoA-carboxylase] ligase [Chloroflexota bacterium]